MHTSLYFWYVFGKAGKRILTRKERAREREYLLRKKQYLEECERNGISPFDDLDTALQKIESEIWEKG